MESLKGSLLVAGPALYDPNFSRSVVLVLEHNEEGAMGVILNRASESPVDEAVPELAPLAATGEPVFVGGPVQPTAAVVVADFEDASAAASLVVGDVGLLDAALEPEELEAAVRRARIYAGYAGWGPGQLEAEMERDDWIVEAPLPADLFHEMPEELWSAVLARKGGQYALVARMPDDPSLN